MAAGRDFAWAAVSGALGAQDALLAPRSHAAPDGISVRGPLESAPGLLASIEREEGEFRPSAVSGAVSGHTGARRGRTQPPLSRESHKEEE